MSGLATSTALADPGTMPNVEPELGVRVHLRDVETLDDLADVSAAAPVQPGDLVATVEAVYRVEVVLIGPPGARCVPVLARRVVSAVRLG